MSKPSKKQIRAVRLALYNHQHISRLKFLREQLGVVMNFNHDRPLPEHDIRNPPGSGPNWILQATGAVDTQC